MPVVLSVHDEDGQRCVDIIELGADAFCFKEFRKDAEDPRRWYVVNDFSAITYGSKGAALQAKVANCGR